MFLSWLLGPLENPIGFGVSDYIELALASVAVAALVFRPLWLRLARQTVWCMLLLGLLPVLVRMVSPLRMIPLPPAAPLEFSNLLMADNLRHFRLSDPPHPLPQF